MDLRSFDLLCPLRTSVLRSKPFTNSQLPFTEAARQISRGKHLNLRCTTTGVYGSALDGYGLHDPRFIRPAFAPDIQFLFVGSHLCSTLPSDPASQLRPCASLVFTSIRLTEGLSPSKLVCMPGTPRILRQAQRLS